MLFTVCRLWNEELRDAQRKGRKPRLRNAFIKFLGIRYFMLAIFPIIEVSLICFFKQFGAKKILASR